MQIRIDDVTALNIRHDLDVALMTLRQELEREITEGSGTIRQEQLQKRIESAERGKELISDAIERSDQERKRTY